MSAVVVGMVMVREVGQPAPLFSLFRTQRGVEGEEGRKGPADSLKG